MENPIVYDGIQWFLNRRGYYVSHKGDKTSQLHRYIYEHEYGPIPEGYQIHHIDENTQNNSLDNLKMMTIHDHRSYHNKKIGSAWLHTPEAIAKQVAKTTGQKRPGWTEETRAKHHIARAKQVYSEESKKKMSESAKRRVRHPFSEEHKRKISESLRGNQNGRKDKPSA
jgi:hypothetical protein